MQVLSRHLELFQSALLHLADMLGGNAPSFFNDYFAISLDVETCQLATETFRNQVQKDLILLEREMVLFEK